MMKYRRVRRVNDSSMKSILLLFTLAICPAADAAILGPQPPAPRASIAMIGNTLGERMLSHADFETELHTRYPNHELTIRNLCMPGDTAAFRPRAGRNSPWAFPGAERLRPEFTNHLGQGHEMSPDEWLTMVKADTILAFFGFNESFDGIDGLAKFEAELDAFATHTLAQTYNGNSTPRLVFVSPIAFEDRSQSLDLPDGVAHNESLRHYTAVMRKVAEKHGAGFADIFDPSLAAFNASDAPLTINGCHLNAAGYRLLAPLLADLAFGTAPADTTNAPREQIQLAVDEKNWAWTNDYRMLNGVHVFGRRYKPFGEFNYPHEIRKIRQMTRVRDEAIWNIAAGRADRIVIDDSRTIDLPAVETNFNRPITYLEREEAVAKIELMDGFEAAVFATEREFPNLRNPVQMSFDNRGRLWVAVIPSYPHYQPGDPKPDDKILIYEDTTGDGRADKETVFADGLHMVIGFEIAPEGVYVAQLPNLCLLIDDNGDDRADRMETILHGFCSHDSHHAISAFASDAAGAIFMCEGVFLHSQVETPYGTVRGTGACIFRFDPRTFRLERTVQTNFANPWGIAFDEWGQLFIADASGGTNWWGLALGANAPHGHNIARVGEFAPRRARPTSGAEFIHSRHFPDDMQGDWMVNNCIGLLGTTTWHIRDDGAGFTGEVRGDLLKSSDPNFRPVDMEFAPDGSLYLVDWHNALIGHMQHSIRDPNRDHDHGRIYRITHKERPLVAPANVAGAPVAELLENLKLQEMRTRQRSQRELRGRPAGDVLPELQRWVAALDTADARHEHHLVEALWVTWGLGSVDGAILARCLNAAAYQARAAAVNVLRHGHHSIPGAVDMLMAAATDPHPRVRLEAIVAASWMDNPDGAKIAVEALKQPLDRWMVPAFETAMLTLKPHVEHLVAGGMLDLAENPAARDFLTGKLKLDVPEEPVVTAPDWLEGDHREAFLLGREV